MSKIIETKDGQTIIDIAIEHCGDVDRLMDIVENNTIVTVNDTTGVDIDLSEALVPGQKLTIQDEWVDGKIIKDLTQSISTAKI